MIFFDIIIYMVILNVFWKRLASYYGCLLKDEEKNGASKIKIWYSEVIYCVFMALTKLVRKIEKAKLNTYAIKKYYWIYGKDDTLNHFSLSEKVLDEILSV